MKLEFKTIALCLVIYLWATLLGAIVYEHIVLHPVLMSALPGSSVLINGRYGLLQQNFWLMIHPVLIVSLIAAIALNWKLKARRKLLGLSAAIYAVVMAATVIYFVPELMRFIDSPNLPEVSPTEWLVRGRRWQILSIIRGAVMFAGFMPLLFALTRSAEVSGDLD